MTSRIGYLRYDDLHPISRHHHLCRPGSKYGFTASLRRSSGPPFLSTP